MQNAIKNDNKPMKREWSSWSINKFLCNSV